MITGVHEFHSTPGLQSKRINFSNMVDNYFNIYSIVQEEGRAKNITIDNRIPSNIFLTYNSDFINYMVSILIDNALKHSIDNSILKINITPIDSNHLTVIFENYSKPISKEIDIFEIGSKVNKDSKGFGYGLNWIRDLESNYNLNNDYTEQPFEILHEQHILDENIAIQTFKLINLVI